MKHIKSIRLGFENCEVTPWLSVPSESCSTKTADVRGLELENIERSIQTIALNYTIESSMCRKCKIVLNETADITPKADGGWFAEDISIFKRIMSYSDITDIELQYADGSEECINMPWAKGSEYINAYQTVKMKNGKLEIVIEKCKFTKNKKTKRSK